MLKGSPPWTTSSYNGLISASVMTSEISSEEDTFARKLQVWYPDKTMQSNLNQTLVLHEAVPNDLCHIGLPSLANTSSANTSSLLSLHVNVHMPVLHVVPHSSSRGRTAVCSDTEPYCHFLDQRTNKSHLRNNAGRGICRFCRLAKIATLNRLGD